MKCRNHEHIRKQRKERAHQQVPYRSPIAYHEQGPNIKKIQNSFIIKAALNDSHIAFFFMVKSCSIV